MWNLLNGYRQMTIWQPWAHLLTVDDTAIEAVRATNPELADRLPKDVENRSHGTTWRGTLLVHAGRRIDLRGCDRFGLDPAALVTGSVVGIVRLVDVVDNSPSFWAEPGQKHWLVMDRARLDDPVPAVGFQGSRPPVPEVLAAVLARLERQNNARWAFQ
jgi:hypothetical protein